MTEAERLSKFADIPLHLAQLVVMRVNATGYSLKFVRSGKRWDNLVDIRQAIQHGAGHVGQQGPPGSDLLQVRAERGLSRGGGFDRTLGLCTRSR